MEEQGGTGEQGVAVSAAPRANVFGHEALSGTYRTKLEPNGRIVLPSALRSPLVAAGEGRVLARQGRCLLLYTPQSFEVFVDDLIASQGAATIDPEARLVWATCGGVRVASAYVPNGRALDHDHYRYKLDWMARLLERLKASESADSPVVVAGDFNIAPTDIDVWDPAKFTDATHTSAAEREALERLVEWGMVDTFRQQHGEAALYSWWDYRAGSFHKHQGMRIDLVLATPPLARQVRFATIDRNARKGQQPSDHAPVIIDFDI